MKVIFYYDKEKIDVNNVTSFYLKGFEEYIKDKILWSDKSWIKNR